jgi:dTDP-4-dehydrorhamnose 3,5-epimerase-like enzyme
LEDNTDVYYMIDEYYSPEASREINYKEIPNLQFPLKSIGSPHSRE